MSKYKTTRQALEAFERGEATLDEVSEAADEAIGRYFAETGKTPPAVMLPTGEEANRAD